MHPRFQFNVLVQNQWHEYQENINTRFCLSLLFSVHVLQ